ncbi:MAG: type II toxin-antitoxin system HicB family antitoxin [Acidobacteriota bacterium]
MNNKMEYKGFSAKIEYSQEDEVFIGHVLGIEDVIDFEGTTVAELKKDFKNAIDLHIKICEREGKQMTKYSGKLLFRFSNDLHARIAATAARTGKSINEFGKEVFEVATNPKKIG